MLHLQVVDFIANKENLPLAISPQNERLTPQLNQMPSKTRRNKWIERGRHSLRKANMSWNIPMNSFAHHLNGKTKSQKMGLRGVLTKKNNALMITWTLAMQECKLSISL
jgi:hypothetical protein